ncbi:uncharacterized protein [Mytilus edulis]|uniref:uncharacterized protein n=1 Tax=Mytilus edulis TaxID=6550 RepID=UPI0039F10522
MSDPNPDASSSSSQRLLLVTDNITVENINEERVTEMEIQTEPPNSGKDLESVLVDDNGVIGQALAMFLADSKVIGKVYLANDNYNRIDHRKIEIIPLMDGHQEVSKIIEFCQKKNVRLIISNKDKDLNVRNIEDISYFGPRHGSQVFEDKVKRKELIKLMSTPTAASVIFTKGTEVIFDESTLCSKSVIKTSTSIVYTTTKVELRSKIMEMTNDESEANEDIIMEEFLEGDEISVNAFIQSDTDNIRMLPITQIKKGNLAAVCPYIQTNHETEIIKEIIENMARILTTEGYVYTGVLCARFIKTRHGPKVITFRCRFMDPDIQTILPLLKGDLASLLFPKLLQDHNKEELPSIETSRNFSVTVTVRRGEKPKDTTEFYSALCLPKQTEGTKLAFFFHNINLSHSVVSVVASSFSAERAKQTALKAVKSIKFENKIETEDSISERTSSSLSQWERKNSEIMTVTSIMSKTKKTMDFETNVCDFIGKSLNKAISFGAQPITFSLIGLESHHPIYEIQQIFKEAECRLDDTTVNCSSDNCVIGMCVGVKRIDLPKKDLMKPGDALIGVLDNTLNETSLKTALKLMKKTDCSLSDICPFVNKTFGHILKSICRPICAEIKSSMNSLLACINVAETGLNEIGKHLPSDLMVVLNTSKWTIPPIYAWMIEKGDLTTEEILDFSLGIGLLFVIRKEDVEYLNNKLKETGIKGLHIGHVQIKKDSKLQIQNLKVNLYKSWTKTEKRDRIAVFIENKDASLQKTFKGEKDRIRLVVLTSSFAKAKDEAEQEGISTNVLERKDFGSDEDFSSSVIKCLNEAGINFLICYESSLSDDSIQEFGQHRCLMTSVGLIQRREERKTVSVEQVHTLLCTQSKVTGVTVYFLNDTDDANIQINQQRIIKIKNDNTETLTVKILQEMDILILNALKGH